MPRYGLVLTQDEAIWLRIVSKPVLTNKKMQKKNPKRIQNLSRLEFQRYANGAWRTYLNDICHMYCLGIVLVDILLILAFKRPLGSACCYTPSWECMSRQKYWIPEIWLWGQVGI